MTEGSTTRYYRKQERDSLCLGAQDGMVDLSLEGQFGGSRGEGRALQVEGTDVERLAGAVHMDCVGSASSSGRMEGQLLRGVVGRGQEGEVENGAGIL